MNKALWVVFASLAAVQAAHGATPLELMAPMRDGARRHHFACTGP